MSSGRFPLATILLAAIIIINIITTVQGLAVNMNYCPLLGPVFPAPTNLATSAAFAAAKANLTSTLDTYVQTGKSSPLSHIFDANETSFTLEVFSVSDNPDPLIRYYYTAPSLVNASTGVQKVDENTVFRIGSISKLWTVLLYLIHAGDKGFHDPVTKYIPELKAAAAAAAAAAVEEDAIDTLRWEDVTIKELASHMAGVSRDCEEFLFLFFFFPL